MMSNLNDCINSRPFSYNVDCFVKGTKQHAICEDYGYANLIPPIAIISDGCSTSPMTDVGSRVISLTALNHISQQLVHNKRAIPYDDLGRSSYLVAKNIISQLFITKRCLNATLLTAFVLGDIVYVYAYGDGFIIFEYRDNSFDIIEPKFEMADDSGTAPYYISYRYVDAEKDGYKKFIGGDKYKVKSIRVDRGIHVNTVNTLENEYELDEPIIFIIPAASLKNVTISSDGLSSFCHRKTKDSVNLVYFVKELHEFKITDGPFLQRRCIRIMQNFMKEDIINMDDFSIATIHIEI